MLLPFWNSRCKDISTQLPLPNYIKESYNPNFKNHTFILTKRKRKKLDRSIDFIPIIKPEVNYSELRTRKIKLYPTTEQRILLKKWMGNTRYLYNKGLSYTKDNGYDSFINLRNKFVTKNTKTTQPEYINQTKLIQELNKKYKDTNDVSIKQEIKIAKANLVEIAKTLPSQLNHNIEEWEFETPKEVRANAIRDLTKAYDINFDLLKTKKISKFSMKYKSKKKFKDSIVIEKKAVKYEDGEFIIYPRSLGSLKIHNRSKKDYKIDYDTRITYNGLNFYIHIPEKVCKKDYKTNDIIALDPGCRNFMTGFSQKEIFTVNKKQWLIDKLTNKIATFRSLRDKKKVKLSRINKKNMKARFRIKNIVTDLHDKMINYLVKNYKKILLPVFKSQEMLGKNKNNNRTMMYLRHYEFQQKLINKASITNTQVYIVTEEYTSKTCTNCGTIKHDLGSSKIFKCESCKLVIDRDVNGARNIFIKNVK